jgi:hypothetical protein
MAPSRVPVRPLGPITAARIKIAAPLAIKHLHFASVI